jgi:hypothetical protein
LNPAAKLVLPPLRDRIADLPELLSGFVRKKFALGADRELLADYMEAEGIAGPPHADRRIAGRAGNDEVIRRRELPP